MALSDQLIALAARAKDLEDRAAAAKTQSQADLEKQRNEARASIQAQSDKLRKSAEVAKGRLSAWWDNLRRSWDEHIAAVRKDFEDRHAAHDLKAAEHAADRADNDAAFAIDFASAAIDEAEYAVLDAELAHRHVEELSKT
jgi:hypothetical protein